MSNFRRRHVPGGTFFFTVNLAQRGGTLLTDHVADLRAAYATVTRDLPLRTDAIVVLPDHLHAIWTLPQGNAGFPTRWKRIKREFSVRICEARPRSVSKVARGEVGIWQRRYWERCVRDETEFAAALRYVWGNPVRHGFVERAVDWPFSSVHREVRTGRLPPCGI